VGEYEWGYKNKSPRLASLSLALQANLKQMKKPLLWISIWMLISFEAFANLASFNYSMDNNKTLLLEVTHPSNKIISAQQRLFQ
jgi:hypothetical protein